MSRMYLSTIFNKLRLINPWDVEMLDNEGQGARICKESYVVETNLLGFLGVATADASFQRMRGVHFGLNRTLLLLASTTSVLEITCSVNKPPSEMFPRTLPPCNVAGIPPVYFSHRYCSLSPFHYRHQHCHYWVSAQFTSVNKRLITHANNVIT